MIDVTKTSLTHNSIKLSDLQIDLTKGRFSVPQFQRRLVWKAKDILGLADSIIRGFPISEVLLMPKNGTLKVSDSPVKGMPRSEADHDVKYILDGQQRLTSISAIFSRHWTAGAYYFDLLRILAEYFPEDDFRSLDSVNRLFDVKDDFDDLYLCCKMASGKKSDEPQRCLEHHRYIYAKAVLESDFSEAVSFFLRDGLNAYGEISEERMQEYRKLLNQLLSRLPTYSISTTTINEDCDLDTVVNIFEKINSGGQKLSLFDLINAMSYGHSGDGGSLRGIWEGDLAQMAERDPSVEKVISRHLTGDKGMRDVMMVLLVAELLEKGKSVGLYTRGETLSRSPSFWYDEWDRRKEALFEILQWIGKECIHETCTDSAHSYTIAILLAVPGAINNREFLHQLKIYMLKLSLSGVTLSKSLAGEVRDITVFAQAVVEHGYMGARQIKRMPQRDVPAANISAEAILSARPGRNHMVPAALHLMYSVQRRAFTQDIMGQKVLYDRYSELDRHHFFPKSRFSKSDKRVDSLANLTMITPEANRNVIKNRMPSEYLGHLKLDGEGVEEALEDNLIPLDEARSDNIDEFLEKRAERISEYLRGAIQAAS